MNKWRNELIHKGITQDDEKNDGEIRGWKMEFFNNAIEFVTPYTQKEVNHVKRDK